MPLFTDAEGLYISEMRGTVSPGIVVGISRRGESLAGGSVRTAGPGACDELPCDCAAMVNVATCFIRVSKESCMLLIRDCIEVFSVVNFLI